MRLDLSGSDRSTNCIAGDDPLPQLAAEAEGSGGVEEREGAGTGRGWDKIGLSPEITGFSVCYRDIKT